jgi:hypothetical protein
MIDTATIAAAIGNKQTERKRNNCHSDWQQANDKESRRLTIDAVTIAAAIGNNQTKKKVQQQLQQQMEASK